MPNSALYGMWVGALIAALVSIERPVVAQRVRQVASGAPTAAMQAGRSTLPRSDQQG